jgi:5-methylcytosine-specific restriction protein A
MTIKTKQVSANPEKPIGTRQERQAIYNTPRWVKLRKEKLMQNPVCEVCNKELADHVHHINSFMNYSKEERINVAYNSNNLQSVCRECHTKIHKKNTQT